MSKIQGERERERVGDSKRNGDEKEDDGSKKNAVRESGK